MSDLTANQQLQICYIQTLPLELLEIVFGMLNINDLGRMLCTSEWTKTAFKGTQYSKQLDIVLFFARDSLKWICRHLGRTSTTVEVPVHSLLKAYTDKFCECGDYGWFVLWFNNPLKTLCRKCLHEPQYQCTILSKAARHYSLTRGDLRSVPTIKVIPYDYYDWDTDGYPDWAEDSRYPKNSVLAQRVALESLAESKGKTSEKLPDEGKFRDLPVGVISVPLFNLEKHTIIRPLKCQRCRYAQDRPEYPNNIPHTYEALRAHVLAVHPEILVAFEQGWKKLHPAIQARWIQQGTRADTKDGDLAEPTQWTSWVHVMRDSLQKKDSTIILPGFHSRLADVVKNEMRHSGDLYGLPAMPHPAPALRTDEAWMMNDIAMRVAQDIIDSTIPKLFRQLQRKTQEGGIKKMRESYGFTSDGET